MKKILYITISILSLSLFIFSCSNDDDNYVANTELLNVAIDSIRVESETMNVLEEQRIYTYTTLERECETFYVYDYQRAGNQRNVVAYIIKNNDVVCGVEYASENFFTFKPTEAATYLFKFYSGKDPITNEDTFIEQEIVVQ